MNANLLYTTQCPNCAKLGKDNSHDNLAVYSDGHSYCYSCKYTIYPSGYEKLKNNMQEEATTLTTNNIYLPEDTDFWYPKKCITWITQYELTRINLLNNNISWSESEQRLIFPIYGSATLIAYQGRYFGTENKPKWFGKGNLKDTFHILGKGKTIILVEDIVSAIKLSLMPNISAMPLFGCYVGYKRFERLYKLLEPNSEVYVWLDPDKRQESILEAKLGRITGLSCGVIWSTKDPKEHSFKEIERILDGHGINVGHSSDCNRLETNTNCL